MPPSSKPPRLRRRLLSALLGPSTEARTPPAAPPRPRADAAPPPGASAPGPQPRADAATPPHVLDRMVDSLRGLAARADSLRNHLTGSGGDKVDAGRPDLYQQALTYTELSQLWRFGGRARRFVEQVPNDATRKGWGVQTGDGEPVDVDAEHKRLRLISRVAEADTWGRLYGGAWLLLVVTETPAPGAWGNAIREPLAQPLDLSCVESLDNLVVLDWAEVSPLAYETDPRKTDYRRPRTYRVHPQAGGWVDPHSYQALEGGATVHASRLVYFPGAKLPPQKRLENGGIDDSVLQSVWDAMRNADSLDHSLAALAAEMRITVLRMRDLSDVSVSDEAEYFDYRMRELAKHRSVLNTVLLADGEDYVHHPGTVAGMGELVGTSRQALQAVTGMPEQLWIGNAPGGLSTDGESHRNLWANVISSYQHVKLLPLIEQIYRVMFAAKRGPWAGQPPDAWVVKFKPLDELTEHGTAALRKLVAETDVLYIQAGVLDPQHVARGRFGPRGWQMELPPIDPEALAGAADLDVGAVLQALAGQGLDPGLLSGAEPQADDGELEERRRLAQQMTEAKVPRCEHGATNRCRLCGVERRRVLLLGENGETLRDEEGRARWGIRWAALGDYGDKCGAEEEPAPTGGADADALEALGLYTPRNSGRRLTAVHARTLRLVRDGMAPIAAQDMATMQELARAGLGWGLPEEHRADAQDGRVSVWVGVPLPPEAMPAWEAARLAAALAAGVTVEELDDRGHKPHVTVLYGGKVPATEAEAELARWVAVLEELLGPTAVVEGSDGDGVAMRQIALHGAGLGYFPPTAGSDGDTPLYMQIDSATLYSLHDALAARLLPRDAPERERWYNAHATVGYFAGELTSEQREALWRDPSGRGTWHATTVELRVGDKLRSWTLADRGV